MRISRGSSAGFTTASASQLGRMAQHDEFTIHSVWLVFVQAFGGVGFVLALLFGVSLVAAMGASFFQFGFLFTTKPLVPSFAKLNPVNGFKRLFSKQVVVNLAKQFVSLPPSS